MLTQPLVDCIVESVEGVLKKNRCILLESGAEPDHIHFLIDLHPDNNISSLLKSMKSVSSKRVQEQYPDLFKKAYGNGKSLWGRQKATASCGGAPLDKIVEYVKNQKGVNA